MISGQLRLLPGVGVGIKTPHDKPRCHWGAGCGGRSEYKYLSIWKQQQKHKPVKKHMAFLAAQSRWDTRRSTGLTVEPERIRKQIFPSWTTCLNQKEEIIIKTWKTSITVLFLATLRHYQCVDFCCCCSASTWDLSILQLGCWQTSMNVIDYWPALQAKWF